MCVFYIYKCILHERPSLKSIKQLLSNKVSLLINVIAWVDFLLHFDNYPLNRAKSALTILPFYTYHTQAYIVLSRPYSM